MERDEELPSLKDLCKISTHTLTWSVTVDKFYNDRYWRISTHTLTWSVTQGEYFFTA